MHLPITTSHRRAAFTLLELIVVITIIGILATFVSYRLIAPGDEARLIKACHDIRAIVEAAEIQYLREGSYPETLDELRARVDEDGRRAGVIELYDDPWGNPYLYELSNGHPTARSLGADGAEGGDGLDADLVYPEGE